MNTRAYSLTFISAGLMTLVGLSAAAESKEYLKGDRPQQRGYSEAVITEGGRMVWLAGQTATLDDNGKSLASDFDGQVRQLFKNLDRTLQKAGGKLGDLVQMTVFITDVRYGDRLTQSDARRRPCGPLRRSCCSTPAWRGSTPVGLHPPPSRRA